MAELVVVPFAVEDTDIDGLKVIRMKQVTDDRGTVREFYRSRRSSRPGWVRWARGFR